MEIKIDFRENNLIDKINEIRENNSCYENISITVENLPLGDIIITQDGNEIIIVERKTWKDLEASIKDGRYKEQGYRLSNCSVHNHNIFYLIEGDLEHFVPNNYGRNRITKTTLLSSLTSISYSKGFSLYKSQSIRESALWLLQMTEKIRKSSLTSYYVKNNSIEIDMNISDSNTNNTIIGGEDSGTSVQNEQPYYSVVKRVKKNNITPENIGYIMLSQIPNVSTTSAEAIMNKFNTLENLINEMRKDSNVLNNIFIETKTGKTRRLTKKCMSNIYNYLLSDTTNVITIDC